MAKELKPKTVPFKLVTDALLDRSTPFSPKFLHRFSDLTPEDAQQLKKIWAEVDGDRRSILMEDLDELNNHDTLVCFDTISKIALDDTDPRVRAGGINLLRECNDHKLVTRFIAMLNQDPDDVVRATAAGALGLFVYLGEVEELPPALLKKVENALIEILKGHDKPLVKRRSLEALGFSSRKEVPSQIKKAYAMEDEQWQASALFAMGRSADDHWGKYVIKKLNASDEVQFEAVRAAGELELSAARRPLLAMLEDYENLDEDLCDAVIWSLSKIGGEDVRETLERVSEEIDDDDELEFIQNALDNLEFTEGGNLFAMMDFEPQSKRDLDKIVDLEEETYDEDENENEDDDIDFDSLLDS